MKEYSFFQSSYWSDEIFRKMSPEQKSIYFYLLTGQQTNWCGVFKLSIPMMGFFVGYREDNMGEAFSAFLKHYESIVTYDEETGEVAILNWAQMNLLKVKPNTLKSAENEAKNIESEMLLLKMVENTKSSSLKSIYLNALRSLRMSRLNEQKLLKSIKSDEITMTTDNALNDNDLCRSRIGIGIGSKEYVESDNSTPSPETKNNLPETDLEKLTQRLTQRNQKHKDSIIEIVDAFNRITGQKCRYSTKGALKLILYWLNEGYNPDDFETVFKYKFDCFNGTDNAKYISIDTFCRQDKFEDNLQKATQVAKKEQEFFDVELNPDELNSYKSFKNWISENFPNVLKMPLKASEFRLLLARDKSIFGERWNFHATENDIKRHLKESFQRLNSEGYTRTAHNSLLSYLKTDLKTRIYK